MTANEKMTLDDVVKFLRQEESITFILGAGASKTAGIPLAPELIAEIKTNDDHCLRGLSDEDRKDYGKVMGALTPRARKKFIQKYLDASKPNWGYLAFASLLMASEDFVGATTRRVLSFNFDLLVERTLAMLGHYLPVYDFGVAQTADVSQLAERALIHLHGQSYGFKMLNSDEETSEHAKSLRPLFDEALNNHVTIVIGYSGESDAAFKMICETFTGQSRLFWLGFEPEPASHLRDLLDKDYVHYIGGCDFEQTMIFLAQKCGCFPPLLLSNPPDHVLQILKTLPDFPVPSTSGLDVVDNTKERLTTAADEWETAASEAEEAFLRGQEVKAPDPGSDIADAERNLRAWSLLTEGHQHHVKAKTLTGEEQAKAFQDSFQKYDQALAIKPDMHEALNNWGNALLGYAQTLTGEERAKAFQDSFQKFEKALKIKPNMHEALNNWGNALANHARGLTGEEQEKAFQDSFQKFKEALAIKPDMHEALHTWGNALLDYARTLTGEAQTEAFQDSFQKYEKALVSKPDNHKALNNWGNALLDYARTLTGEERTKAFLDSFQKYDQALAIKPDMHEALHNWGAALLGYAETLTGEERERCLEQAEEKVRQAEALSGKPSYNLACLLALRGQADAALDHLEACARAGTLPSADHLRQDEDLESLRALPRFAALVAQRG